MNITKIALALLLTCTIPTLKAKWINTDEIKEDLGKGWQAVKTSPEKLKKKIDSIKKPKRFQIAPQKDATLKIENGDTELKITLDGVTEDILTVSHEGETLTITINKK